MSDQENPQASPYVQETDSGKYAWCSCAKSANQPFCDGSHRGTEMTPVVVEIEEKKTVAWCGCKKTGNPPYCDGSHASM